MSGHTPWSQIRHKRLCAEPIQHRSETIRKAFGFSRFKWYIIAPVEYRIRYLLWKVEP